MVTLNYTVPADIVALDKEDRPVLLVKVVAYPPAEQFAEQEIVSALKKSLAHMPFAMIVDRRAIRVYSWDGERLRECFDLDTTDTLRTYSDTYDPERSGASYLEALVGSWLRDIAYQWKSLKPPGRQALEQSGLWDKLAGGITVSEDMSRDPVY